MDEVFDYASFMWDPSSSLWQQESPDMATAIAINTNVIVSALQLQLLTLFHPLFGACRLSSFPGGERKSKRKFCNSRAR